MKSVSEPIESLVGLSVLDALTVIEGAVLAFADSIVMQEDKRYFQRVRVYDVGEGPLWSQAQRNDWHKPTKEEWKQLLEQFYLRIRNKNIGGALPPITYVPQKIDNSELQQRAIQLAECAVKLRDWQALELFESVLVQWVKSLSDETVHQFVCDYHNVKLDDPFWNVQRCRNFIVAVLAGWFEDYIVHLDLLGW
jgi:hypothetical protein